MFRSNSTLKSIIGFVALEVELKSGMDAVVLQVLQYIVEHKNDGNLGRSVSLLSKLMCIHKGGMDFQV